MKALFPSLALVVVAMTGCKEDSTPNSTKSMATESVPKGWPTDWEGESLAELGDGGRIRCTILLTDGYTPSHLQNYKEIMERWDKLWPAARKVIEAMLSDYHRDPKIKSSGNYLQITIPAERISEGAEWSIALQKAEGDGVWTASFEGWKVSPDESQPYF